MKGRWASWAAGILLAIGAGAIAGGVGLAQGVVNPVIDQAADPFMTRVEGLHHEARYLLLATHANGITIWSGKTVEETPRHPKLVWKPADGMTQVWSPTIWKMGGRWWVYFTAAYPKAGGGFEKHAIYVLESKTGDPLGEYAFKGKLALGHEAIDPSILRVGGVDYLMYVDVDPQKWNAVWITRLTKKDDGMETDGDGRELIHPDQPWERGEPTTHNYPVAEGPTALYHGGKTFVVYSGSDTGTYVYCLGLLTYRGTGDVMDKANWVKTGPVFSFSEEHGVYGPGRGTFVSEPDGKKWWLVYHAKTVKEYTYSGRTVRMQPFAWKADGTPDFGVPVKAGPEGTGNRE